MAPLSVCALGCLVVTAGGVMLDGTQGPWNYPSSASAQPPTVVGTQSLGNVPTPPGPAKPRTALAPGHICNDSYAAPRYDHCEGDACIGSRCRVKCEGEEDAMPDGGTCTGPHDACTPYKPMFGKKEYFCIPALGCKTVEDCLEEGTTEEDTPYRCSKSIFAKTGRCELKCATSTDCLHDQYCNTKSGFCW